MVKQFVTLGALKVCRWVSPQAENPNHGVTETRRKAIKKLRGSVSPWFSLLGYLQPLSAPWFGNHLTAKTAQIKSRTFARRRFATAVFASEATVTCVPVAQCRQTIVEQ